MGNYVQDLSDRVTLIAAEDTWIEGDAIQQLHNTAKLPGMSLVAGMPDLHPGRGYPVGAAFFAAEHLYPALIGGDIGCGMALWQTDIDASKASIGKLEKKLGNIDGPLDDSWQAAVAALVPADMGFQQALGTIGGGNHFAELQRVDEVYDPAALAQLKLKKGVLQLLVHSGSRGLGQHILRQHIDQHGHTGLVADSAAARGYLQAHDGAVQFAEANRQLIARRILARLHAEGEQLLDITHNMVCRAQVGQQDGWMHRKGATPADRGAVVIPGSRGDYSYLVQPLPNAVSLYSLAHGAGRKWMRSECKDRLLKRYSYAQLSRTRLGSHVICADRELIYEEAPEAYKPIDNIVAVLAGAGLLQVVARLKPVLTYKTRGECCD
ncbi:RtcB family protein [Chitinimonas prasina]|uniref:3'-phosphate/5'-hydroxy nucleic acid ligase n=1 Tax=Chitinimonas prasina TaxID=1434937 RepID=A0ABQ5YB39_9NEIS|nr:RNA ligase RtcB family protein [Chitinimonas prasina]GLR11632.1 RtcB family protein [Chitinimonas prasina]